MKLLAYSVVILPLAVLHPFAHSQDLDPCPALQTQQQELKLTLQQIESIHSKDRLFLRELRASQKAWLQHQKANQRMEFPNSARGYYGSVLPECLCVSALESTEARIRYLKRWLEPAQEGDVCAGSTANP